MKFLQEQLSDQRRQEMWHQQEIQYQQNLNLLFNSLQQPLQDAISGQPIVPLKPPLQNQLVSPPMLNLLPLTLKQFIEAQEYYRKQNISYYQLVKYRYIQLCVRFIGYDYTQQTYIVTDETTIMKIEIKKNMFQMKQSFNSTNPFRLIVQFQGEQKLQFNGVSLNIKIISVHQIETIQMSNHFIQVMKINSQIKLFWNSTNYKALFKQSIIAWIKQHKNFQVQQLKDAFSKYDQHILDVFFKQLQDQFDDKFINHGVIYQYISSEQQIVSEQQIGAQVLDVNLNK